MRVLIVEDESLIAMDLAGQLEGRGYSVVSAVPDVQSALRCIQTCQVDFAVLDSNLNGQPVTPVAHELRCRGVPFAYCTAYAGMLPPDETKDAPVLGKPFSGDELDLVISGAIVGEGDGLS